MIKESDFLYTFFQSLEFNNIRYAVLRNYESLPNSTGGSDIDIWVHNDDYTSFVSIMNEVSIKNGGVLASIINDSICPRFVFQGLYWGVQLDVHIAHCYHKNIPYIHSEIIKKNINQYNGIHVLSKDLDSIISFLKELLNNKSSKLKYCNNASTAVERLSPKQQKLYLSAFSEDTRHAILDCLLNRSFDQESLIILGTRCSKDLLNFKSNIKYVLGQIYKLHRVWYQPGYTIAFLGTDGAGKSFIINSLTPILNEAFHNGIRYEHMRPNYIPSLAVLMGKKDKSDKVEVCSDPHGSKPAGFPGSLLRLSYYWIDYTLGYFRKIFLDKAFRTHLWIFDRYYYDYIVDPLRARLSLPSWIIKFYGFFVPCPDLIICLGGEPEKIYARKPETSLEEVKRQTAVLQKFCNSHKKAVWVDTTVAPELSINNAMQAILKMMSTRFKDTIKL